MNQTDAQPEKRLYPRVTIGRDVELDVFRESRVISCVSVNLSLGGARVRSQVGLDVGQTVLVTLRMDGRVFTTFADVLDSIIVVDQGEAELRLRFWDMSAERRDDLDHALESVT